MSETVNFPRVRYLCGLEESWDQPTYIYPLRDEDSGWTTVKRRRAAKRARRSEVKKPSGPSVTDMVTELRGQ